MESSSRISASLFQESMRRELTARAHSSRQGIEACIRRAKDVVFLPLNELRHSGSSRKMQSQSV